MALSSAIVFADEAGDGAPIDDQLDLSKKLGFIFRLATARSANDGFWAILKAYE